MSRRYQVNGSTIPFVNDNMFRSVWFSYIRLQCLDADAQCPECGPDPQDTIWDGVTLAFSQKHLLPSLQPPTVSHEHALQRDDVRYRGGQQLIADGKLRKAIRHIVQGRSLVVNSEDEDSDNDQEGSQGQRSARTKRDQDLLARVQAIPDVCAKLKAVDESLSNVFGQYFGIASLIAKQEPPAVYKRLFVQVS
jgi:hypothetical protein